MRISENVFSKTVAGQEMLVDMASGFYFGLDEIGTSVWNGLREGRSQDNIIDEISHHYEMDRETVRADVEELIHELKVHNLIG